MSDRILTIPEAAARLSLSEARIRQLIASGVLPSAQVIRPRGQHRIHSDDVCKSERP